MRPRRAMRGSGRPPSVRQGSGCERCIEVESSVAGFALADKRPLSIFHLHQMILPRCFATKAILCGARGATRPTCDVGYLRSKQGRGVRLGPEQFTIIVAPY